MEIPNAEAEGIKAIAVNDRPLQLPNADGAIKLQITPHTIGTYTREEIFNLINERIQLNMDVSDIIYVPWVAEIADAVIMEPINTWE